MKYIFVVGGVMSGVGKGVTTASLGKILQSRGLEVTALKIDPYVNVDAGTMNPTEHGEVFVLDDGTECDQDLGNYERFLGRTLSRDNYMTTGSIYQAVITRERNLGYGGRCVSVVPHIPLEVLSRIKRAGTKKKADIAIVEVGGTVGEYENILFLEAIRILKLQRPGDVLLVLVSFIPALRAGGTELKTKPTQHAVRAINGVGLHPDVIVARALVPLDKKRRDKIAFFCSVGERDVISAPDVESIYEIPLNFERQHLSDLVLKKLALHPRRRNLRDWRVFVGRVKRAKTPVRIGIVGKYFGTGAFVLEDSYISVLEAIKHAAAAVGKKPVIEWVDAEEFERDRGTLKSLSAYNGVVVPGGFGTRGVEGKIAAIRHCRTNKIPFLGLCYGMQLAVVEFARSVLHLKSAHTTEIHTATRHPVIDVLPEQKQNIREQRYGGTMRLGAYPAVLIAKSIAQSVYRNTSFISKKKRVVGGAVRLTPGDLLIFERHRHRYEVNPTYVKRLEKSGLLFSGTSPNRRLMEIAELPQRVHPFFVGTQFHPELKSRPLHPHPLFLGFLKAAIRKSRG